MRPKTGRFRTPNGMYCYPFDYQLITRTNRFVLLNELFLHILACIMADDGVGSRFTLYVSGKVGSKQKVSETTWGLRHLLRNYDMFIIG